MNRDRVKRTFRGLAALLWIVLAGLVLPALSDAAERWAPLDDMIFETIDSTVGHSLREPNAVAEDGDGYLWVGTANGLIRWDGYAPHTYPADPGDPHGLPDNLVQCLHTDPAGQLWIGTSSAGLVRYDRRQDRFETWRAGPAGLSHVSVRAIADDGAGGLWVGTDGGLDHLDPSTGRVAHGSDDRAARPSDGVLALLRDRTGTLWIGTEHGLARRAPGDQDPVAVALPVPDEADQSTGTLLEDSQGRLWVGTRHAGAYVREAGAGAFRAVGVPGEAGRPTGTDWITQIVETRPGEVWLGTYDQGILAVDTASWAVSRIRHDRLRLNSLPHDNIRALHRDRSGLVWVGTNGGLSHHNPAASLVATLNAETSRSDGVSDKEVFSVHPAPDGRVWLGLSRNGVDILDPLAGRVAALRPDPGHPDTALPRNRVWAIAAAPDGATYLGTERGLYRADPAGAGVRRVVVVPGDPELRVAALLTVGQTLWIGTAEDGLWQYDLARRRTEKSLTEGSLTDRRVESLAADGRGGLWVGTDHGLNRLDLASGAVEQILPDPARRDALSAGFITSLLVDPQERLWIGTLGGGIDLLAGREAGGRPIFRSIGLAEGLPHPNVDKLLVGSDQRIWVSTDDGIAAIEPASLAVRSLDQADGVAIAEYLGGSGAVTPAGEVLFGGVGGLTVIRPERLAPWTYAAPLVLTDLRVGGRRVPQGTLGDPGSAERLAIPPEANKLSVGFAALDYAAPERIRYAYRLDGFDRAWIETDARNRQATYTNLPPGDYTLRIRGTNHDGAWVDRTIALPIRVLPAWYQAAWFRLAVAAGFVAAVFGIVQVRTSYLRQRQSLLEGQVAQRTAELQNRTVELEEAHRQLEQIAYIDPLTALPNRRMFTEDLRKLLAISKRRASGFALLLLDLDRFKVINDTLGHDAGDALLVEAGVRFKAAVRASDIVARLGGDEFAILLTESYDTAAVEAVCRRIIASFVPPVVFKTQAMSTSPSIGVVLYPEHGEAEDTLYKAADLALYAAKRAGRNTWRWHGVEA